MTDVFILLLLFLLNGLFAMCEIALVSSRRSRLKQAAKNGSKGAKTALKLSDEPEKFLSTVQIGITLVGIIAGAYGADAFTKDLQPLIEKSPVLAAYSDTLAFAFIITAVTYLSLIIGELVPKTLALNNPEKITIALAPFMKVLTMLTYPLVLFLSYSTRVVLKMFFIRPKKEPVVTEEELKYMIDTGSKHGIIEKQEGEMLHSVFKFADKKASHLMIYRRNIKWLNASQSKEDILKQIFQLTYTKYPVCENSLDRIIGFVSITDVLQHIQKTDFNIHDHLKEPVFFPEDIPALRILEEFRRKKVHIGFVIDQHGRTSGLITLHDLVENIVGELPDSDKRQVHEMLQREDGSWLISAQLPMSEIRKTLSLPPDPATARYTLEIYLKSLRTDMVFLGDTFDIDGYRFEIVDMDGSRIDKVLAVQKKADGAAMTGNK